MTTNTFNPFERALELLGPNGENWHQGSTFSGERAMCLLGALGTALGYERPYSSYHRTWWVDPLGKRAAVHTYRILASIENVPCEDGQEYPPVSPACWNDDWDRTFDDVRTLLEKAAATWDEALLAEGDA